jgi:flagella basal body P-ring formation protein FlgA
MRGYKLLIPVTLVFCLISIPTILLAETSATGMGLEIRLLAEAEVSSDTLSLGQLAEITGGTEQQRQSVAALVLGPSPSPGKSNWIHQGHVQTCLTDNGIALEDVSIKAAGPVKVLRSYESLTSQRVCEVVKAFILQSSPWDPHQIKIRSVSYNQSYRLPPGNLQLQVSAPKHTDWIGAIPFRVDAYVDGRLIQRFSVPAHIEVWSDVVVAAKPLGRRQPIELDDIKVQHMNLSRVPKNAILRKAQILGCRTVRAVALNAILSTDQVEIPPVIKKGDVVQMVAETPLLKVSTKGMAKDKGAIGDRIPVVNLNSNKIVYAQIVDQATVRVEF